MSIMFFFLIFFEIYWSFLGATQNIGTDPQHLGMDPQHFGTDPQQQETPEPEPEPVTGTGVNRNRLNRIRDSWRFITNRYEPEPVFGS